MSAPYPIAPHLDGIWRQCCACKVFYGPDGMPLVDHPAVPPPNTSHGYCAACFLQAKQTLADDCMVRGETPQRAPSERMKHSAASPLAAIGDGQPTTEINPPLPGDNHVSPTIRPALVSQGVTAIPISVLDRIRARQRRQTPRGSSWWRQILQNTP
jgi:hypothetical protein